MRCNRNRMTIPPESIDLPVWLLPALWAMAVQSAKTGITRSDSARFLGRSRQDLRPDQPLKSLQPLQAVQAEMSSEPLQAELNAQDPQAAKFTNTVAG